MTSIDKTLRQRDQATSFASAPSNPCYYTFIAISGNYVGNYSPGYMQKTAEIPTGKGILIRDMGKTIKAPIGVSGVLDINATSGFFRAVQFIFPVASVSATGSTTFGVGIGSSGAAVLPTAGNIGDTGYGTYYIPVVVDGTLATSAGTQASVAVLPSYGELNGQM
jgi:hypothetical protein